MPFVLGTGILNGASQIATLWEQAQTIMLLIFLHGVDSHAPNDWHNFYILEGPILPIL